MIDSRLDLLFIADEAEQVAAALARAGDLNAAVTYAMRAENVRGILHNLVPRYRCRACRRLSTTTACSDHCCHGTVERINPT